MGGARKIGQLALAAVLAAACSGADDAVTDDAPATSERVADVTDSSDAAPAVDPSSTVPTSDAVTPLSDRDADEPAVLEPAPTRCDPDAVADAGPITLRVWHGLNGDVEGLFPVIVGRFEAEHPGIRVELEKVTSDYPAAIDLLSETPADALPDVMMGSNQTVRLQADSGRFIPPSECTDGETADQFDDLLPVVRRTYTVEDVLWAAPFNASTPVMLYDRGRWERAGLDPDDPPATFDGLVEAVRRLRDSGEAFAGLLLYDRSAMWFIEQHAAQEDRLLVEPANGRVGRDVDRFLLEHPSAIETLTTLHELKRDGYIEWLGYNPSGIDDLARMVHPTEPGGITFNSSAVIGDVSRLLSGGEFPPLTLGVAPFPGPAPGATVGGGAWWLLDRDDPARAGAAWQLVDWLTQPAIVAEIAAYTGYVPTTTRAAEHEITLAKWAESPEFRVPYDQLAATPDSDAGAGIQVGPMVQVLRNFELAAAYPIDVGSDPASELRKAEELSLDMIQLYVDSFGGD